jgi:hypothetical protein
MGGFMRMARIIVCSALFTFVVAQSPAFGQKTEISLGIGYSHLSLNGASGELDEQGGGRIEPRFSWQPFSRRPELRFGIGMGFSYYYDTTDAEDVNSGPFTFDVDNYEDVALITPEFQVSWRQPMSERWWLEGGVGVGPAFAMYTAGDVVFDDFFDEDVSESDVGLGVRPFIRAGFRGGDRWSWGVEGSYQWSDIDFGAPFGGDAREWYVGLFFSFGKW